MANIRAEGWQECLSWVHALCIAFETLVQEAWATYTY